MATARTRKRRGSDLSDLQISAAYQQGFRQGRFDECGQRIGESAMAEFFDETLAEWRKYEKAAFRYPDTREGRESRVVANALLEVLNGLRLFCGKKLPEGVREL